MFLLLSSELFLRLIDGSSGEEFFMFPPNAEMSFLLDNTIVHDVGPVSRFSINSLGFRGELPGNEAVKILVIGGSTVENLIIDDTKHWPKLLGDKLDGRFGEGEYWVGNAGRSGLTTYEHILQLRHMPDLIEGLDAIVALVGGNDMAISMRIDSAAQDVPLDQRYGRVFLTNKPATSLLEEMALHRLWRNVTRLVGLLTHGELLTVGDGQSYVKWMIGTRAERRNALPHVDRLPDMTGDIARYVDNLKVMHREAKARSLDLILVTQPQMFGPGLTDREIDLLGAWWGSVSMSGPVEEREYYSVDAVYGAGKMYREATLAVCGDLEITCIDAGSNFPPLFENYYDGVHYTDTGNGVMSEIVFQGLVSEYDQNAGGKHVQAKR